ncbi:putative carbon-nitrogen hydrolase [freshwater metagenome]|uniref:Putative carbon-nitrogen hydrolase n=1 Tax=freshwater metagenome TaxID=449393 RepID=A0A094QH78_9ZZZZ
MKVAVIQVDTVWENRDANFAQIAPLVATAVQNGATFVLLTEMFSTGFVVNRSDIGEPEGGPSSQFLSQMASQHKIWIGGSCPEVTTNDSRPFNSFVLVSPHGEQHRYHKIHPFTFGGEDTYFRAGENFVTVNVDGVRVTLFVCYDLRFADEFWATAANTDLYLVPGNWPASRREHWMALLRARAIENQAFVIGCNRVGTGGGLEYAGDSRVVNPLGEVIAEAGDVSTILYADISSEEVQNVRTTFRFMQDRR